MRNMLSSLLSTERFSGVKTIKTKPDTEDPIFKIPVEIRAALRADAAAAAVFEKLPDSHKKEYLVWILDAKKSETRQRRITKALEMLSPGRRS
jgi:uncharacterized protein YdeI (YjbR/CyaY-like superfamily)